MKLLSRHHGLCTRAPRRVHLVLSLNALLGACSLDTTPESPASRAALQNEAETSSLDTPTELNVAEAPAPTQDRTQTEQPSAAVVPAQEARPAQQEAKQAEPAEPKEPPMAAAGKDQADEQKPLATTGCKPGDYAGVIAGTVNLGPLEVSTLTGKISLQLVADKHNENLLRVQRGRVEGVDLNKAVFVADITGEVDCATGQLVQSEVERGMYEDTTEVIKIGFSGVAEGRYQTDPPSLLGTWNISDDSTLIAGQGVWSSTLAESIE